MMSQDIYADDFETLYEYCRTHDVAMQTIKSVARRRWADEDDEPKFAWYMPLKDVEPIRRAVHYVLARPGLFLNTSSDATILRHILDAASQPIEVPNLKTLEQDVERYGMAPIFVRGETDEVR